MPDSSNPWVSRPTVAENSQAQAAMPAMTVPPATGPVVPQADVRAPDHVDRLAVREHARAAELWWVGVHGGAGESTLAELVPQWRSAQGAWPRVSGENTPARVVLVARSNAAGLRAAQTAATQWAAGLVPHVELLGLVIVADAPGRLPRPLRDLVRLVGGGVPRTWTVPWAEQWRLGHDVSLPSAPRQVRQLVEELTALIRAGAPAGTANRKDD
ncbi:DUF6668 family protein [Georgenia satyanarayanai]|uniref:DUF6668 family protein n=1 Tax=Georgenia satyanarayanai TaxID=860221 RepID=UPI000DA115D9|nr:DUF6668 family protein [Georgenia satyanarayanai]